MGHEDFSLIQVVKDFLEEKWPLQPFKRRGKPVLTASLEAIDYDHYGIEWPFLYVIDDVVYVVKHFDDVEGLSLATPICAADPLFFDKLTVAIEKYLQIIVGELFLP